MSAGGFHSLALIKDRKVYAWGRNDFGQANVIQEIQGKVNPISAGSRQNIAVIQISEPKKDDK
ncbi:MAG: RCC1-like domain-containing protein [Candidatus Ratteibacteria bacterium]